MSPGRLEAFSDGVIAIAITLLSLEIRLPDDDALTSGLLSIWPSYVGFVLSFLLIGQVWLNHHAIFQKIRYVDQWVLVCNLLLLLDVAFLPLCHHRAHPRSQDGGGRADRCCFLRHGHGGRGSFLQWAVAGRH